MAEDKRSIYNRSGLGHRIGYGKRPALLVVDMQIGFTAPERSPLAGNLDAQVAAINKLIPAARKNGVPIVTLTDLCRKTLTVFSDALRVS